MKNSRRKKRNTGCLISVLVLFLFFLLLISRIFSGLAEDDNSTVVTTGEITKTEKTEAETTKTVNKETSENIVESEENVDWDSDGFVFYFQDHNQPWSDDPHGSSTIAKSGCGTVSLSMCLASLTGDEEKYTPDKLASYEQKHNIDPPNQDVDCIPALCEKMKTGCTATLYYGTLDFDLVDETLKNGGYIILDQKADTGNENTSGIFAHFNHYIVIRKGNQKDGYYIANSLYRYSEPGSTEKYAPQNGTCIPAEMFTASYYYTITKD